MSGSSSGVRRGALLAEMTARETPGSAAFIFGGAGAGIIAKAAIAAGLDAVMTYNIAKFRMDGHASLLGYLPYGDANAITLELAPRIIPAAGGHPVIAGVGAADPYREMGALLDRVVEAGFSGVVNTPTAGIYEGGFREEIERAGIGYGREVDMVKMCRDKEIFSLVYAFGEEDAATMAAAGADAISPHLGTTGAFADLDAAMEDAVRRTNAMAGAARAVNPQVKIVAHGGPLESPDTVRRVLELTAATSYIAGSSLERIPVTAAVGEATRSFSALPVGGEDG